MKVFYTCVLFLFCNLSNIQASEVSLIKGGFDRESAENWKETTIAAGLRFSEAIDNRYYWFSDSSVGLIVYDKPGTRFSLALGLGLRMYLDPFTDSIAPYVSTSASLFTKSYATGTNDLYVSYGSHGLSYGASVGLRINLDIDFFLDLEANMFNSNLYRVNKSDTTTVVDKISTSIKHDDKTNVSLFVDTKAGFKDLKIILGFKF